jgi:hypothetical protein
MIITICSTIKFWPQILEIKRNLETLGHQVLIPPHEVKDEAGNLIPVEKYYEIRRAMMAKDKKEYDWIWQRKKEAIMEHFSKVNQAEAF